MSFEYEVNDKSLEHWIDVYSGKYGPCLDNYLRHYEKTNLSVKEAVRQAVKGRNLKIHRHQFHVGKPKLRQMAEKLLALAHEIDRFRTKSFDELHLFIKSNRVKGFGSVAIYDTSLRLAAHFGKRCLPKDVYLHAGAKKGYVEFKKWKLLNAQANDDKLKWDDLPAPWRRYRAVLSVKVAEWQWRA